MDDLSPIDGSVTSQRKSARLPIEIGAHHLFFAPFVSSRLNVSPDWIDYNGHLNMAYYHVLFDRAVDEAFALCGLGPDYIRDRAASFFLVESRISYRRELKLGDRVRITVQLLDVDDKRMHYLMQMHEESEGWLAAACENLSIHVDAVTRRAAPFPSDIRANLEAMRQSHAMLPRPASTGQGVSMRRDATTLHSRSYASQVGHA